VKLLPIHPLLIQKCLFLKSLLQFTVKVYQTFISFVFQEQAIWQAVRISMFDYTGTASAIILAFLFWAGALLYILATHLETILRYYSNFTELTA